MSKATEVKVTSNVKVEHDFENVVTIIVGKESSQKSFVAHESHLRANSPFFAAALNGTWIETQKREVKLLEEDPSTFRDWLDSVYSLSVFNEAFADDAKPHTYDSVEQEYHRLCKVYLLAERLLDIRTKNAIISAMFLMYDVKDVEGFNHVPSSKSVTMVYDETPEGNRLRRLLVDFCSACDIEDEGFKASCDTLPKAFLADLFVSVKAIAGSVGDVAGTKGRRRTWKVWTEGLYLCPKIGWLCTMKESQGWHKCSCGNDTYFQPRDTENE